MTDSAFSDFTDFTDFTDLPDLASRRVGGAVVFANDELFAEKENLIRPEDAVFQPHTFGHRGQVYDGWETRRRREPGFDFAVVRLGVPGVVRGVVVDTAWFRGNYPPEISVEGASVEGYPSPAELEEVEWTPLVPRSAVQGDTRNCFPVDVERRVTHVRLCLHPDGGVARLRVHGEPVADPRVLDAAPVDLAALESGATVLGCSNRFYSSPTNLIAPGQARVMGEGWETARRRDDGNDWVFLRLAETGRVLLVELDTTHFVGNAPGWASVRGTLDPTDEDGWFDILPRTRLQPDTRHLFPVGVDRDVSHVRLDVYPDGGMARLRLYGALTPSARERLGVRWFDLLGNQQAHDVVRPLGLSDVDIDALVAERPYRDPMSLRKALAAIGQESLTRFLLGS
ncbi:allantoicase [Streptoalloteichus tenebrarius]|uniref:Probable allantoicase n=1 Tax=Streptoalloteichus tenebrarius (strain ATCC 17920 / DSM 40477 / JCM 4838 / CBS 697.72 / NBRC 16177 / NCIMB 11028 / NRRL B-12390 / A12253. 1 / ISP 5477) TaxID=1933 RepID=A0ABT1HRP2_STRSD|nr:allantoicase [Streptoalloteichus tenebrarius]MCP2258190.1 allantoicase [Streptoalloteichus tenebrarius]BFF04581.1 allantoicase [Streptoalloteichus tenebrarius]